MGRLERIVVFWLVLSVLVSGVSTGQSSLHFGIQSADSVSPILIDVEPSDHVVEENDPAAFAVIVQNPSKTDPRQVFLTVGANTTSEKFSMEVADGEPWYEHEDKLLWAKDLYLAPGGYKIIGVIVYPESPSGTYEINATAAFLHDGSYVHERSVSQLTIPQFSVSPSEPTSTPPNPAEVVHDWLEDNWMWLIPLLSLVVAILSFFGYERVHDALADEQCK